MNWQLDIFWRPVTSEVNTELLSDKKVKDHRFGGGTNTKIAGCRQLTKTMANNNDPTAAGPSSSGYGYGMFEDCSSAEEDNHPSDATTSALVSVVTESRPYLQTVHSTSNTEDAYNYLDIIKARFSTQPEVYNTFLEAMKEFKSGKVETPSVVARIVDLFRGHNDIILGFNDFLPSGITVKITSDLQVNSSGHQNITNEGRPETHGTVDTPVASTSKAAPPVPSLEITLDSSGKKGCVVHPPPPQYSNSNSEIKIPMRVTQKPNEYPVIHLEEVGKHYPRIETLNVPVFSQPTAPDNANSVVLPSFPLADTQYVQSNFPIMRSNPVEFNAALDYVNRIRDRFKDQPGNQNSFQVFKDILCEYPNKHSASFNNLSEEQKVKQEKFAERKVYEKVAKLLKNDDELLKDFRKFLSSAFNENKQPVASTSTSRDISMRTKKAKTNTEVLPISPRKKKATATATGISLSPKLNKSKRPAGIGNANTKKAMPMTKPSTRFPNPKPSTVPVTEIEEDGRLAKHSFFEKLREVLESREVYDDFIRSLSLYNKEIITQSDILNIGSPVLIKFPEVHKLFKIYVGVKDSELSTSHPQEKTEINLPQDHIPQNPPDIEFRDEWIDYKNCEALESSSSYRIYPKNYQHPICSGRTPLDEEVLNDVYFSYPFAMSPTSRMSSSHRNIPNCQRQIQDCEDQRYELDNIMELCLSAINIFERLVREMSKMSEADQETFKLDDCFGGTSSTIQQRAIKLIYGEGSERAEDILEFLKSKPLVCVPVVLTRLNSKVEEWREAQKILNPILKETLKKYSSQSLDYETSLVMQMKKTGLNGRFNKTK